MSQPTMIFVHNHSRIRLLTCAALFIVLIGYFMVSYSYYPGLAISFEGTVSRAISGHLYWDYGEGFTDDDFIEVRLNSEAAEQRGSLGTITVEPSGLRNNRSRGDMVWLVFTKHDYEQGDYTIEGRHQWMGWVKIKWNVKGRQLALFPGSKITLTNEQEIVNLKFFKTPDSGIARITSEFGPERFFDGYGRNKRFEVSQFRYNSDIGGEIHYLKDPHRKQKHSFLPLPHHRIKGLRFEPFREDLITDVRVIESLKIRLAENQAAGGVAHISSIAVNGKRLDSASIAAENVSPAENGYLLSRRDQLLEVLGPIYSFEIGYLPEGEAGIPFEVMADEVIFTSGTVRTLDESLSTLRGEAEIVLQGLVLEGGEIRDATGQPHPISFAESEKHSYVLSDLRKLKQHQFNPLLFTVQILTALLASIVVFWLLSLSWFKKSNSFEDLIPNIFYRNGNWLFWLLFTIGVAVNFLWLLAEWPGCLTPDSVNVHSGVKQLKITNHHPYIYSLFVLGLYNFYDGPLSVIVFQIAAYNALIAGFMTILYKEGLKWWLLLPLCCATFLLIPVNLYNLTLWKDIPFTMLILFWAFFLTFCYYRKRYCSQSIELSGVELFLLSLLFVSLCTFRHNGVVYIAFIPLALLIFTPISRVWIGKFFTLSTILLILYYLVFPEYVLHKKPHKNNFAKRQVTKNITRAAKIKEEGVYLEHYLGDRVERFTASLGTSSKATTWYNDMNHPPQRWFSVDQVRGEFKTRPKIGLPNQVKDYLLQSRSFRGYDSGRFIHWNSLFSLVGLIVVFLLYKWLPLSAFYSSFFLYQTAALFFVVWARWRYMYFLYLGGVFLLIILMLEWHGKKRKKISSLNTGDIK